MYKKIGLVLLLFFSISGCGQPSVEKLNKVGLLVPETVNDQVWGTKGYKGLLKIQSELNVDVFYKEGMDNAQVVRNAIEDFQEKGVNLVFGHGSEYESFFEDISKDFPDIHFVFTNGVAKGKNVTSLNFEANAMGFFGGMVAGEMSETNKVGVLAAFEWQPEVNGFFEGAYYQNEEVEVDIKFVQDWDNAPLAMEYLDVMIGNGVDVVYVAGDGYNVPVIEKLKEEGLYAIGFASDQADLGEGTVLTSTVQHIDRLYKLVAKRYNAGELESGDLYFDFQDEVIDLGKFSPQVDESFKKELENHIKTYQKTKKLPNQF